MSMKLLLLGISISLCIITLSKLKILTWFILVALNKISEGGPPTKEWIISTFTLLLVAPLEISEGAPRTKECYCGYGGLCFKEKGKPVEFKCGEVCPRVSGTFYSSDCHTIRNHCESSPCIRGECVNTFGNFFCQCPEDYFGKTCDIFSPLLKKIGLHNEFYIYHQVQPKLDGSCMFYIAYDPLKPSIARQHDVEIRLAIELFGKRDYPTRNSFLRLDLKKTCLEDVESNPSLYDANICKYLPAGEMWTFPYECTINIPSKIDPESIISLPRLGKIGRRKTLHFSVKINGPENNSQVLLNEDYVLFTYNFHARIPHNCLIDLTFDGCSPNADEPTMYSSGELIQMSGMTDIIDCDGALVVGSAWFLQKNIEPIESLPFDRFETRLYDSKRTAFFRRRYFDSGLHMLGYMLTIRGNPPFLGSTKQFTKISRCWIRIPPASPHFSILGGDIRTENCFQSLRAEVILTDGNYELNEFYFVSTCFVSGDDECAIRDMEGPYLNKMHTPCDTTYKYSIVAFHRNNVIRPVEFFVVFIFIDSEAELLVECIYNCYPINPEDIVLVGAWTVPYAPDRVSWDVTVEGISVDPKYVSTTGFHESSRILRMDGAVFAKMVDGTQPIVDVVIRATKYEGRLNASIITQVNIVSAYLPEFEIKDLDENRKFFTNTTELHYHFNAPLSYSVYSISNDLRELIVEARSYYIHDLVFQPRLNLVHLCLRGSLRAAKARKCTEPVRVKVKSYRKSNLAELDHLSRIKDTKAFLASAQEYIMRGLTSEFNPTKMLRWSISEKDKNQVRDSLMKVDLLTQFDTMSALSIISMLTYSGRGCLDQDLPEFKDDVDTLSDLAAITFRLKSDLFTINLLKKVLTTFIRSISGTVEKLRTYRFGDIIDKTLSTWTLLYLRDTIIAEHRPDAPNATVRDIILSAEVNFWHLRNYDMLNYLGFMFIEMIVHRSQPFYGLRYAGRGAVRMWITNAPYSTILKYTNKSRPLTETFPNNVNYFFDTPDHETGWISTFNLSLPENMPEVEYDKLSCLIVVVRNRKSDKEISPSVVIFVRRRDGSELENLYKYNGYNLTLPVMADGVMSGPRFSFAPRLYEMVKGKNIDGSRVKQSLISTYRLHLQGNMSSFAVFLYSASPVPLKVAITYYSPAKYEDLVAAEDIIGTYEKSFQLYKVQIMVYPLPGEVDVRQTLYLNLLPADSTPPGRHYFWGQETISTCSVSRVVHGLKVYHSCTVELPFDHDNSVMWNRVLCICYYFGSLTVVPASIRTTRVIYAPIDFVLPEPSVVPGALAWTFLLLTIIGVLIAVIFLDIKRVTELTLVHVEDAYPVDTPFALVIGIFTGMNPLAWTTSTVAIKIYGSAATSRVHILKLKNRRAFLSGTDDWFVIPLQQPLGRIISVSIWLDYNRLSDWYCSRIVIFDVKAYKWYSVEVERWLKLTDADGRLISLPLVEVEEFEEVGEYDKTFSTYYFRELKNTHLPWSIFYLHPRSTASYEEKFLLYGMKIFGIVFWVWIFLEYVVDVIFETSEDEAALKRVTSQTSLLVLMIASCSRIFTVPLQILDRFKVVSGLLQKRTTQPLLIKSAAKGRSESVSTRVSRSGSEQRSRRVSHRESRYSRSERSRPSQHSSADFRRNFSKGPSAYELLWYKADRSTRLISLTIAPHQFRCVNVGQLVFTQKARWTSLTSRVVFGILLVSLLFLFIYIDLATDYRRKLKVTGFLILMTLFYDAILLEPIFTFIKSFIAYVFFNMTHKEVNMWNADVRPLIKPSPPLDFGDYVEKVTQPEYKPLLTSELEKKRMNYDCYRSIILLLYYLMMLMTFLFCYTTIHFNNFKSRCWTAKAAKMSWPSSLLGAEALDIKNVVTPKLVESFVSTVVTKPDMIWSNGKYITRDIKRWGYDHSSTPLEATNVIILAMSSKKYLAVPLELDDFLYAAYGKLNSIRQRTDAVMVGKVVVEYNVSYRGTVSGLSRQAYPLAGNTFHIANYPWSYFSTHLRYAFNNLLSQEDLIIRAIIVTSNYYNSNSNIFCTKDTVFEFLPSGVSSAVNRVSTSVAFSQNYLYSQYLRGLISVVTLIMAIFVSYLVCKPIEFLGKWQALRMWLFFLACFCTTAFSAILVSSKYARLKMINFTNQFESENSFTDVHLIYLIDVSDQLLLSSVIFMIAVEAFTSVYRLLGSGRLGILAKGSLRVSFGVYVMAIFLTTLYGMTQYNGEPREQSFTIVMFLRQLFPLDPENKVYAQHDKVLCTFIIFFIIFTQFFTSCAVFLSYQLDVDRECLAKQFFRGLYKNRGLFTTWSIKERIQRHSTKQKSKIRSKLHGGSKPFRKLGATVDRKLMWLLDK